MKTPTLSEPDDMGADRSGQMSVTPMTGAVQYIEAAAAIVCAALASAIVVTSIALVML
jgi:hypothetical protein